MRRGQPYSLAATVIQRCVITPGPSRSASVTVSPAIGCLLSLFESGSGLLEEDRPAVKSFSLANSSGSCAAAGAARAASAAAARASTGVPSFMSTSAMRSRARERARILFDGACALVVSQHADRIDLERAPRGDPAGGEARAEQQDRHAAIRGGVEGLRFEEEGREESREQRRRDGARGEAEARERQALADDEAQDVRIARAEREPDADLAGAPAD